MGYNDFLISDNRLVKYQGHDTEVVIPNGVVEIYYSAFKGCKFVRSIYIPHGVRTIMDNAFSNCKAVYSLDIAAD